MQDTREKTYRSHNVKRALVPQLALEILPSVEASVLDFGCGKDAYWVKNFMERGIDCDGIDLSRPDLSLSYGDEDGLYDVIMLSNVINVQETLEQLTELLEAVARFCHSRTSIVWNYPNSPRKMNMPLPLMEQKVLTILSGKVDRACSPLSSMRDPIMRGKTFTNCFITHLNE